MSIGDAHAQESAESLRPLPSLSMPSEHAVAGPTVVPPAPAISEPAPSPSYSETARTAIEAWRKKLTDTPATPAR
jgi:hypothetical protein